MDREEDKSIQLIITSPPYLNIKDYEHPNQIGFNPNFKDDVEKYLNIYLDELNCVWKEGYRVLENGCYMIVNIGDMYLSSKDFGTYRILPLHSYITINCVEIGFDYLGCIIWRKISTTRSRGKVNANYMGSFPFPPNPRIAYDYEYILIFKKKGERKEIDPEIKEKSKISKRDWEEWVKGHWYIAGEQQKEGHPATFPLEISNRLIRMFSFYGETVLDCFLGSGSSMRSARDLYRNCIGYEINEDYLPIIKKKVLFNEKSLFEDVIYNITYQSPNQSPI